MIILLNDYPCSFSTYFITFFHSRLQNNLMNGKKEEKKKMEEQSPLGVTTLVLLQSILQGHSNVGHVGVLERQPPVLEVGGDEQHFRVELAAHDFAVPVDDRERPAGMKVIKHFKSSEENIKNSAIE